MERQLVRPALKRTLVSVAFLVCCACGSNNPRSTAPPASETQTTPVNDIASANPQVRFFHEQLIANGEDVQTEFGTYLSTLGMNPRDLQQDDPTHAYDTVMEKVRSLPDAELRRQMLRAFFNLSEQ